MAVKYKKLANVPENLKTIAPVVGGKPIKLSLSQANELAKMVDSKSNGRGGGRTSGIKKAKQQFIKNHIVRGGKWMAIRPENEKSLTEVYAEIEGSYESRQRAVRQAVRGSKFFGKIESEWEISVEATLEDEVVVSNSFTNPTSYYKADWEMDDDGEVTLSNIRPVEVKVVLEALNKQDEVITEMREATGFIPINETFLSPLVMNEVKGDDGKTRMVGSVKVAQRSDVINGNDRRYRKAVLKEAIENVQDRIKTSGPLLMDSKHRTKLGKDGVERNDTDIRETVALIKKVSWDDDEGTVSLDEIEFVDTQAGREVKAVAQGGAHLQVSQRASGAVELVHEDITERVFQDVMALNITGWDFVPPTEASVGEADFEFQVVSESEVSGMAEKKVPNLEEVQALIATSNETLKAEVTALITKGIEDGFSADAIVESLKEAGIIPKDETPGEETPVVKPVEGSTGKPAEGSTEKPAEVIAEGSTEKPAEGSTEKPAEVTVVEDARVPAVQAEVTGLSEQVTTLTTALGESKEQLATFQREKEVGILLTIGAEVLTEAIGDESYARFNPEQKKVLLESVDVVTIHGKVDVNEKEAIKTALVPMLVNEVTKMDSIIAASKIQEMGYPGTALGNGVTHVEILSEAVPNAEYVAKMKPLVEERLMKKLPADYYQMPVGGPEEKFLNEVLHKYDKMFWPLMQKEERMMNEANEEVMQLDIGVRVATLSRIIIEAAYRRLTALQICDIGTMTNRIEDLLLSSWLPVETNDIADDMASVEIAEGGTIPTAGITYTNTPIYSIWRPLRTFISSNARATARNTAMNPEADAIAGLSLDLQRRVDRYLWQLHITYCQLRDAVEVSAYETLTATSVTNEYQSLYQGWVRYEMQQTVDGNDNPTGQELFKLYAIPGTNVLQELDVREAGGDNTALLYDDDYIVNWADGSITLTAAGAVKENSNGIEAKYTYSIAGTKFWSVVPPTGVNLYDHLINLRQQVGAAKVLVANRNYAPNFLGMSLEIEDLVTSGPQFTAAGTTASDMLSRLNEVMAYAGLKPIKTSAIPQQWIVAAEEGSCVYRVHTPWNLAGPIKDKDNSHDYYLGEEYTGAIVPVDDKLALVGITDLRATSN